MVDKALFYILAILGFTLVSVSVYNNIYSKGVDSCESDYKVKINKEKEKYETLVKKVNSRVSSYDISTVNSVLVGMFTEREVSGEACRKLCEDKIQSKQEYPRRGFEKGSSKGLSSEEGFMPESPEQYDTLNNLGVLDGS